MTGKVKMSQVAASNGHFIRHPFTCFLDSMVQLGIQNIDLLAISPHLYMEDATSSHIGKIKNEIDLRHLNLVCFTPEQCLYPINIAAKETVLRVRSLHYMLRNLDLAAELGASLYAVSAGWAYKNEPLDEAWRRSKESIQAILEKAAELRITITLDDWKRKEANLITGLDDLTRMMKEMDSPGLKAIASLGRAEVGNHTANSYFRGLGKALSHVRLVDAHQWGHGTSALEASLHHIEEQPYKSFITIEITDAMAVLDPHLASKKALENLRFAT